MLSYFGEVITCGEILLKLGTVKNGIELGVVNKGNYRSDSNEYPRLGNILRDKVTHLLAKYTQSSLSREY